MTPAWVKIVFSSELNAQVHWLANQSQPEQQALERCRELLSHTTAIRVGARARQKHLVALSKTARSAQTLRWLFSEQNYRSLPGDLLATWRNLDSEALYERAMGKAQSNSIDLEMLLRACSQRLEEQGNAQQWFAAGWFDFLAQVTDDAERQQTARFAAEFLAHLLAAYPMGPIYLAEERIYSPATDPWIRRNLIYALAGLQQKDVERWCDALQRKKDLPDSLVARSFAVEMLFSRPEHWAPLSVMEWINDPSELVRFTLAQQAALTAENRSTSRNLVSLFVQSPRERDRAAVAQHLPQTPSCWNHLHAVLTDSSELVVEVSLEAIHEALRSNILLPTKVIKTIQSLSENPPSDNQRRALAVVNWIRSHQSNLNELCEQLASLPPDHSKWVSLPQGKSATDLADALVSHAEAGFGFWLKPSGNRVKVTRGDNLQFQFWRAWHEWWHPAPAKRQGYLHTVGRGSCGPIAVPPNRLAEASATGVPGQRVLIDGEQWGSDLPMIDDLLQALKYRDISRHHQGGSLHIRASQSWIRRQYLSLKLSTSFAAYDELRSESVRSQSPEKFEEELLKLGFEVHRQPHKALAFGPFAALLDSQPVTILHLGAAVTFFWLVTLGQNIVRHLQIRYDRWRLRLVIGGWGTRGKSSTERLKSGMLHGLGIPLVSKTTGCEAMFLTAPPGGPLQEIFLFRPFDKATIWEQADVLRFARKKGAKAMLWECMALNPRYVDILQQAWMRDDISTITNAYPDHEDIQGPTGQDVAAVIGRFAPNKGHLITTEQNMVAVLKERARQRDCYFEQVSHANQRLIATDLTSRMPYNEHPSNIALTTAVAQNLGIHPVEAVGLMADNVVPDLGALIITPYVLSEKRNIQFVNGMSANDLLSFQHNWNSAGFATHDHHKELGTLLLCVINNRGDRPARTQAFARIIVRNANAHRHLVIGTGHAAFKHAMAEHLHTLLSSNPLEEKRQWKEAMEHLRVTDPFKLAIFCAGQLQASDSAIAAFESGGRKEAPAPTWSAVLNAFSELVPALTSLGEATDESEFVAQQRPFFLEYLTSLAGEQATAAERAKLYTKLLLEKVVYLNNADADGDEVVNTALQQVPAGTKVRMMGMQNIKGTGLDFCYQWVRWHSLHPRATKALVQGKVLKEVIAMSELTCAMHCDGLLMLVRDDEAFAEKLRARRAQFYDARGRSGKATITSVVGGWFKWVFNSMLGVGRAFQAKQILSDLANQRISHTRARDLLAQLTKDQK